MELATPIFVDSVYQFLLATLVLSYAWDIYTHSVLIVNSFYHITSYYETSLCITICSQTAIISFICCISNYYFWWKPIRTFWKHINCKNVLEVPRVLVVTTQHSKSFTSSSADNFHFHPGLTVTISHFPHGRIFPGGQLSGLGLEGALLPQTAPPLLPRVPWWALVKNFIA